MPTCGSPIPTRTQPLKALGFELDTRLWMERAVGEGQPGEADVYDRNGQWIAIMQWPAHVRISGASSRNFSIGTILTK